MTSNAVLGLFILPALLFALLYFPVFTRLSRALVSPYPKPDVKRRLFAANVDSLLLVMSWLYYRSSESVWFVLVGAVYLLARDATQGRSVGKFLAGLMVINLETGRPCTFMGSVRRNLLFLLPGANVVAVFFETVTLLKDPQGQRLGDKLAQTHVVEGFGIKDVAESFIRWWTGNIGNRGLLEHEAVGKTEMRYRSRS